MTLFVPKNRSDEEIDYLELAEITGLSEVLVRLLCARGINTVKSIAAFLNPTLNQLRDPFLFLDMDKAVARINRAIADKEPVCVFGDYDTDGVCATSMLVQYLKFCGANCFYHIPSRHGEGYGLSRENVEKMHEVGAKLIITVDNGITAQEEIAYASELGMETIVTDHHRCFGELPKCEAVICHTREDNTYPDTNLCGAGTALKLIQAHGGIAAVLPFLPYAGLATVADVVPLTGENRAIVALSIEAINNGTCPIGIEALLQVSKCVGRPCNARDFAYALSPRINAAGRMDNASLGVEMLCSDSLEQAYNIALRLDELNSKRREDETCILNAVIERIESQNITERYILIEKSEDWNSGIIGIAASRLVEKYSRPVILFSQTGDTITGSGRSIPGVDIHGLLSHFADRFKRFGGHTYAAGITMDVDKFEDFRRDINEYMRENITDAVFYPRKSYELMLPVSAVSMKLIGELMQLAPFGEGNPNPTFRANRVKLVNPRRIGANATHLQFKVNDGDVILDGVSFEKGDRLEEILDIDYCDILYTPIVKRWNDMDRLQINASEIRASDILDIDMYIDDRAGRFEEAYIKNVRYNDGECTANVKSVNIDEVIEKSSFSGNLFICFSQKGARRMLHMLDDCGKLNNFDIRFAYPSTSSCAYNTLLLAPLFDADLSAYRRIYICDCAYSLGALQHIYELSGENAEIYAVKCNIEEYAGDLYPFEISRDTMKQHYGALWHRNSTVYETKKMLLLYLIPLLKCKRYEVDFALEVLTDIGILLMDNNGRYLVDREAKNRKLMSSNIYRCAMTAKERLIEYGLYVNAI